MGLFRRALAADGTVVQYKTGDDWCGHARPVGYGLADDAGHVEDGVYLGIEEAELPSFERRDFWVIVKDGKIADVVEARGEPGCPDAPAETFGLPVHW